MRGHIRQRSPGSWEVSFDLGRDAFGKRRTKWVTVRGTKAEAQRKLREMLTTLDQGRNPVQTDESLRDWLDRWMTEEIHPPKRRQRTYETYRNVIDRHIVPYLGSLKLAKVGPIHVQELENRLSKHLSPKMVNQVHIVLSGAFKYALRMELVHRSPVATVSPPSVKSAEIPPPDIPAIRRVLELARSDGNILYPAMHLVAYTGMRRGEAMGLLWEHVDLPKGTLRVECSLVQTRTGTIQEPPKTNSGRRIVDLDAGTVEVLEEHRQRQEQMREKMGGVFQDLGWVFADELGDPISPKRLYDTVKRYGEKAGHPATTVRSLRHFHASLMLQGGENPVVVSKRLGHSKVSTTLDIYAHVLPGRQRQAAEAFAEAMEREE